MAKYSNLLHDVFRREKEKSRPSLWTINEKKIIKQGVRKIHKKVDRQNIA